MRLSKEHMLGSSVRGKFKEATTLWALRKAQEPRKDVDRRHI